MLQVIQEVNTVTGLPICNENTCPTMSAGRYVEMPLGCVVIVSNDFVLIVLHTPGLWTDVRLRSRHLNSSIAWRSGLLARFMTLSCFPQTLPRQHRRPLRCSPSRLRMALHPLVRTRITQTQTQLPRTGLESLAVSPRPFTRTARGS